MDPLLNAEEFAAMGTVDPDDLFADFNLQFAPTDGPSQSISYSEGTSLNTWLDEASVPYSDSSENILYNMNARLIHIERMIEGLEGTAQQVRTQTEQTDVQIKHALDLIQCLRRGMAAFTKSLAGLLQPFYHWAGENQPTSSSPK